jgi:MFS family permease
MNNNKLGARKWTIIVIFGLIGQIAWTIENMYLNVYLYRTVTYNPDAVAWMVALSAAMATVATLTMGALSDKLGKRKLFMTIGYIIWGLSIIGFAFITTDNVALLFPHADKIILTIALMILLDCLMTFIGSTSNDASFFAWVNDVTKPGNRGKAEGLLAAMPLIGMLVVFGALDGFTQSGNWLVFFLIVGVIVIIAGVLGIFLIKDESKPLKDTHYLKELTYGFMPKNIKQNWLIYVIFTAVSILGIAQQVFLPYFIIYFTEYIQMADYTLVLASILTLASILSFIGGRLVDKFGRKALLVPATVLYAAGMLSLFFLGMFLKENQILTTVLTIIGGTIMMGAYLVALVPLNALARDIMPKSRAGVFSGLRMVFFVLIPMVVGPFIGSNIINIGGVTYIDEFDQPQLVPNPYIFLFGAMIALLTFIPIFFIIKTNLEKYKEERHEANESDHQG